VLRWCNCYVKAMSLKPISLIILVQFLILLYFIDFWRTFYCTTFGICCPVFRKSTFYRLFFIRLDNGNKTLTTCQTSICLPKWATQLTLEGFAWYFMLGYLPKFDNWPTHLAFYETSAGNMISCTLRSTGEKNLAGYDRSTRDTMSQHLRD